MGWLETTVRDRAKVEILMEGPSLRAKLGVMLPRANRTAARPAGTVLAARGEEGPAEARAFGTPELTLDQVLGDCFPSAPGDPTKGP